VSWALNSCASPDRLSQCPAPASLVQPAVSKRRQGRRWRGAVPEGHRGLRKALPLTRRRRRRSPAGHEQTLADDGPGGHRRAAARPARAPDLAAVVAEPAQFARRCQGRRRSSGRRCRAPARRSGPSPGARRRAVLVEPAAEADLEGVPAQPPSAATVRPGGWERSASGAKTAKLPLPRYRRRRPMAAAGWP
jgi:hypothetical protein